MLVRTRLITFLFLLLCPILVAQQALNNDAVVKLVKAGLSDDLIVSTINASPGIYDTSTSGLISLKSAGVSDKVVEAILGKAASTAHNSAATALQPNQAVSADPNNPDSAHDAGIYTFNEAPSGHKMAMLEPSVYGGGKTGGFFASAMTYGIAKAKVKAIIRGAHSNTRITDAKTIFYFYFEEKSAGLSNSSSIFGGTSTPNEYTLLRFDVKKSTRETTIGKFSEWGGSSGNDEKATVPFAYVKLRPGVYKVTPSSPLKPGEYGFVAPGIMAVATPYGGAAGSSGRVFDFGVD